MARGKSWGRTRFALTRMGLQAEAVAALKGGEREVAIIGEEYELHMADCIRQHKAFFVFGCIDRFFRCSLDMPHLSAPCVFLCHSWEVHLPPWPFKWQHLPSRPGCAGTPAGPKR